MYSSNLQEYTTFSILSSSICKLRKSYHKITTTTQEFVTDGYFNQTISTWDTRLQNLIIQFSNTPRESTNATWSLYTFINNTPFFLQRFYLRENVTTKNQRRSLIVNYVPLSWLLQNLWPAILNSFTERQYRLPFALLSPCCVQHGPQHNLNFVTFYIWKGTDI